MNATPSAVSPDDPLAQAEGALQRTPVPRGPSDETVARTLAALAYQVTVQYPDMKDSQTMQFFFKEPGQVRMECAGGVGIARMEQGKTLVLDPTTKTAMLLHMLGKGPATQHSPGEEDFLQLAADLRQFVAKGGQAVGQKQIGDVQARGFWVNQGPEQWLVWADPETLLPLRIEITDPQGVQTTLSDLRFNPKLDAALFRLEVPEGYKLRPMEIDIAPPEEALVKLLRAYADTAGGKFPERLDDPAGFDWQPFDRQFGPVRGNKAKETFDPEGFRFVADVAVVCSFLYTLAGAYGYKPDGAKLGDADKIIFWYRPAGATKFRALSGDLRWAEVTTDQLPEIPKL